MLGSCRPPHRAWFVAAVCLSSGLICGSMVADESSVSPISDLDRQHWSFRPLARLAVPEASHRDARTPVDAFLQRTLAENGLGFSIDADRFTLLRRMHLDLVGVPPASEVQDAFQAETRPDAYERQLDVLLASPQFGERWGRHWLDVAGYVDTIGFDTDATNILLSEGKWRYRDYVVHALNSDKPYDEFLAEQVAGDELHDWRQAPRLTDDMREALIATGYLRTARDLTHEDVGVIPQNFYGIAHDTLEIVGTSLLGLTLNCARCHDHKFDPIPQEDYYRLLALFRPAYNPDAWRPVTPTETRQDDRGLPDLSPREHAEFLRQNSELDKQLTGFRDQIAALQRPTESQLREMKMARIPEAIRHDLQEAIQIPAENRSEVQKYLAEKLGGSIAVTAEEVQTALGTEDKAKVAALESQIAELHHSRRTWGKIQALYDVGPPPPTHLLIRGSESSPGREVPPGFLRVLSRADAEALAVAEQPFAGTSGRRKALADWLTRGDTPAGGLVARVMVNRVWQQIFGRGIVATADNFGVQGEQPTHPELLEWLGSEFVEQDWQIKRLIRQLMTSTAYRQSSYDAVGAAFPTPNDPRTTDPGNKLLWRMRLRRLDAETIRDSILAASGQLNLALGGPPVMIQARPDGMVVVAEDKLGVVGDKSRRSIYLVTRRAYNLTLLTVFDQPAIATNCLRRESSAVPLQSLVMLNGALVTEQAEWLATRIEESAAGSADARIEALFRLVLARRPSTEELTALRELLADQSERARHAGVVSDAAEHQALVHACHTVLNTSEFLYAE